ncbi:hypothetical protein SBF1_1750007 [Candidatus Desulfosporosinus infrequens]|uniref:Uncharacterized protein n=1 Tax=Candidatus Desulfosporosinus infrequens TaxID=2043169 RepID=A0A2U3KBY4_9FIRM|nr:hypothetical protein SBF1_1750007 [Candidatus Desulfosporosinus infrequens]
MGGWLFTVTLHCRRGLSLLVNINIFTEVLPYGNRAYMLYHIFTINSECRGSASEAVTTRKVYG